MRPVCRSVVVISAAAAYPFSSAIGPTVDYSIGVEFKVSGPDRVTVSMKGWHDTFPWYEFILIVNGVRRLLYTHDHNKTGPGLWNLGGFWAVKASAFATVSARTPTCCSIPNGSCSQRHAVLGAVSGGPVS